MVCICESFLLCSVAPKSLLGEIQVWIITPVIMASPTLRLITIIEWGIMYFQCLCFFSLRCTATCQRGIWQTPYISLESQSHSAVNNFTHNYFMKKSNKIYMVFFKINYFKEYEALFVLFFNNFFQQVALTEHFLYAWHCSGQTSSLPSGIL